MAYDNNEIIANARWSHRTRRGRSGERRRRQPVRNICSSSCPWSWRRRRRSGWGLVTTAAHGCGQTEKVTGNSDAQRSAPRSSTGPPRGVCGNPTPDGAGSGQVQTAVTAVHFNVRKTRTHLYRMVIIIPTVIYSSIPRFSRNTIPSSTYIFQCSVRSIAFSWIF